MIEDILSEVTSVPASYLKAARRLGKMEDPGLTPVRLAVTATSTVDLLPPYLVVEGARRGMKISPYLAPYGQLEQSLLMPDSPLYQHAPQVVAIFAQLQHLVPVLDRDFLRLDAAQAEQLVTDAIERIETLIVGTRAHTSAPLLISNFTDPQRLSAGLADLTLEYSQTRLVENANARLVGMCGRHAAVHVFDCRRVASGLGLSRWFDRKLWHWSRTAISAEAHIEMARMLVRHIRAALFPACKCLVIDLDNTLWGGVIGEDRLNGIKLGEDYPGNVFKEFQYAVRALKERGILLAIASKNNPADAEQVFAEHPDCVLRLDDFAASQIHWNDKATSIRAIAAELNIGLDAIAFFDDSAVEREWVRSALPEVTVIDVPADPLYYVDALDDSGCFDQLTLTAEDRGRTELYLTQRKREALRSQSTDLEGFLTRLEMRARIGPVTEDSLGRVAQLTNKTNQFNLTTRRYSAGDIERLLDSGAIVLWMRLEDRFGDNGLIAVAIALPEASDVWRIDTFLMSCRVLGRRAETALLSFLLSEIADRGGKKVVGLYQPTPKNGQVAGFYAGHGFHAADDEGCEWIRDVSTLDWPECIVLDAERSS